MFDFAKEFLKPTRTHRLDFLDFPLQVFILCSIFNILCASSNTRRVSLWLCANWGSSGGYGWMERLLLRGTGWWLTRHVRDLHFPATGQEWILGVNLVRNGRNEFWPSFWRWGRGWIGIGWWRRGRCGWRVVWEEKTAQRAAWSWWCWFEP